MFCAKNSPNSRKSNDICPEKRRGDTALVLTYLDSQMAAVFSPKHLLFSILRIFRGKRGVKGTLL